MFNLFSKRKPTCPVTEELRLWLEDSLIWLITQFGEVKLFDRDPLTPTQNDFPIKFDGSEDTVRNALSIVAKQMDVAAETIEISYYHDNIIKIENDFGETIYTSSEENQTLSSGLYLGKPSGEKYSIVIERNQLNSPDSLIATLAHEIAHIKILGEGKLETNDEYLTDLTTVFYGMGIFNANASFRFHSDSKSWSYNKQGYLTQQEWGYALALYAYIRNELKPVWLKFLTKNIASDFNKSMNFILDNRDKVLV